MKKARLFVATLTLLCGLVTVTTSFATVTVGLGQSLEIGFRFDRAFTDTPGVLRVGLNLIDDGSDHYLSELSLYDGNTRLSGPTRSWAQFPYAGGAVDLRSGDFSSVLNRSRDGRFIISPHVFEPNDGSKVARSFSFDPSTRPGVDATNILGTGIVGRATITSFNVIGDVYEPLNDFTAPVKVPRVMDGVLPICCGPFGLAPIGPSAATDTLDVKLSGGVFTLSLTVGLYGDLPSPALIGVWEAGIEDAWSHKFALRDSFNSYPLVFDVNFDSGSRLTRTQDWVVEVHSEAPDSRYKDKWWSTEDWFHTLPLPAGGDDSCWGENPMGRAAAHEFGHFLGLYDEYSGGNNGPFGVQTDGIMGSCIGKSVQSRYFEGLLDGINGLTKRDFILGSLPGFDASDGTVPPGPGFQDGTIPQVPEPSTLILMIGGLALVANRRMVAIGRKK